MGSKKPKAPPPSAEYQKYLNTYTAQNTPTKSYFNADGTPAKAPPKGFGLTGASARKTWMQGSDNGNAEDRAARMYPTNKDGEPIEAPKIKEVITPPKKGEYTGTQKLTEQEYYTEKYKKEQQAFQDKAAKQQAEQQAEFKRVQAEQKKALDAERLRQQNEVAAERQRQADILKQQRVGKRDQILADRLRAEEASIDYVNQQISQEASNAALFGVQYNIDPASKQQRVSDYFSSTWDASADTELEQLFGQVGKPQGFTDFTLRPGQKTAREEKKGEQRRVGRSGGIVAPVRSRITGDSPLGGEATILGA